MKKVLTFVIILIIVDCSCVIAKRPLNDNFIQDQNEMITLISKTKTHCFSNPIKEDTFKVSIRGKDFLSGIVTFEIINWQGKLIYSDTFSGLSFIYYTPSVITLKSEEEKYVKDHSITLINLFFHEKAFEAPAIKDSDGYKDDFSDKDIWLDIKSDPTAIGFSYSRNEEDHIFIAYSKRMKKVVIYYHCC